MNNRFKTINLGYLEEISGGDIHFQKELIDIFIQQVPDFIANMELFFAKNDLVKLAKEAHSAKSSALIFMMEQTGKDLKQIQLLAENNKADAIPALLATVKQLMQEACDELLQYINKEAG